MDIEDEVYAELLESFNDLFNEIEICLDRLVEGRQEDLNALFRSVHTIKGNAAIGQLKDIVDFTHAVEEVVDALRNNRFNASPLIAEVLQLGMDRLRDLHYRELAGQELDNLHEEELKALYRLLAQSSESEIDNYCHQILELLGAGFVHDAEQSDQEIVCITRPLGDTKQGHDLKFFKNLAKQIDHQSRYWDGRSDQLHDWAQKVNAIRNYPVDSEQLSAATYLHDIGMSFIRNQTLEKEEKLTDEEIAEIRLHPIWGYEYLSRIDGWEEAATIILEHHERIDGKGYPNGNTGPVIHDGAKILAILDAFFSITNGRADRTKRRSVVRAVSEINARMGTQFDETWVQAFNDMIKNELKAGAL